LLRRNCQRALQKRGSVFDAVFLALGGLLARRERGRGARF
jgi:hypothetical protein